VPWSEVRTSFRADITVRAGAIIGAIVTAPGIDAPVALVKSLWQRSAASPKQASVPGWVAAGGTVGGRVCRAASPPRKYFAKAMTQPRPCRWFGAPPVTLTNLPAGGERLQGKSGICDCLLLTGCRITGPVAVNGDAKTSCVSVGHGMASDTRRDLSRPAIETIGNTGGGRYLPSKHTKDGGRNYCAGQQDCERAFHVSIPAGIQRLQ